MPRSESHTAAEVTFGLKSPATMTMRRVTQCFRAEVGGVLAQTPLGIIGGHG